MSDLVELAMEIANDMGIDLVDALIIAQEMLPDLEKIIEEWS